MTEVRGRAEKRVYKTYDRPAAVPLDSGGLDANDHDIIREPDGWYVMDHQDNVTGPISTFDLAFPIRLRRHKAGETRQERRADKRVKAKRVAAFYRAAQS